MGDVLLFKKKCVKTDDSDDAMFTVNAGYVEYMEGPVVLMVVNGEFEDDEITEDDVLALTPDEAEELAHALICKAAEAREMKE